jgi:hypothetical protein
MANTTWDGRYHLGWQIPLGMTDTIREADTTWDDSCHTEMVLPILSGAGDGTVLTIATISKTTNRGGLVLSRWREESA